MRLETAVATITPADTGMRAAGPQTINAPTEMPAAGQKTEVPVLAEVPGRTELR